MSDIQKRLSDESVGVFDRRPMAADLIALDGFIYKYVGAMTGGAGVWKMICRQVEQPGIDFALAEHVPVTLPPDKLIAALILAKTPMAHEQANEMVQTILTIMTFAGWTHPDSAAVEPVLGTITIRTRHQTKEIVTDDLRPVLAMMQDPDVHTLFVKDTEGVYHRFNVQDAEVTIEVAPSPLESAVWDEEKPNVD